LAADRWNENGLQLENIRPKFLLGFLAKLPETDYGSPFEKIIRFLSLNVLRAFCVPEKVYEIFFRTFFYRKADLKMTVTEPL